ncbi:alkene reductase [Phenylobacterium sp.]|jgi:N-ethylmaleimide reductase|uniref:alkene reductase n=1 Tax=Phenylobacterium sp. TaxID=1871053 RepID=UPI002E35572C|nr:alkene reductase [Phenylobacterium sp.]HEX4709013.1 alkene reductase [Phenylobacterium sp.]
MSSLFAPFQLGDLRLPHRVVMAPMTRSRAGQPGNVPTKLMAEYYAQRAGAALIVTEATQISPQGQGYSFTPGIHSQAQISGWKLVTEAVRQAGGRIFLQLWHVGRMSHASLLGGAPPVAPSAIAPDARVWIAPPGGGTGAMVPVTAPRALTEHEIAQVVEDYAVAARNALRAGFDGVEIHGANGYLIDQFLRRPSNRRTDCYGGSMENRIRFLDEVVRAVASTVGPERTGVRLSPYITERGMADEEIIDTILAAAARLQDLGIAYLHLAEADWEDEPIIPVSFRHRLRATFRRPIIVAGKYDKLRADEMLKAGLADLVAFGRAFVANPDLPGQLAEGRPLARYDPSRLFGGDAEGYTTYGRADAV